MANWTSTSSLIGIWQSHWFTNSSSQRSLMTSQEHEHYFASGPTRKKLSDFEQVVPQKYLGWHIGPSEQWGQGLFSIIHHLFPWQNVWKKAQPLFPSVPDSRGEISRSLPSWVSLWPWPSTITSLLPEVASLGPHSSPSDTPFIWTPIPASLKK